MASLEISWVVAAAAGLLALGLLVRVAGEGGRTTAMRAELEELRKQDRGTRKQQEQRDKALHQAEAERDKSERKRVQAENRASQARDSARSEREAAAERIRVLDAELASAHALANELRAGGDSGARELERVRAELAAGSAQLARAEEQRAAAERAAAERPRAADPAEDGARVEARQASERRLAQREQELSLVRAQVERLEGRLATQNTLYTSIRAELAARKDEIRQQREQIERLQAYKVALVDAPAADGDREPDA